MGMLVIRVYSFDCDACGAVSDDFVPTGKQLDRAAEHVRRELRGQGWTFSTGGRVGCPAHPIGALLIATRKG